jgi:hypothetical protein
MKYITSDLEYEYNIEGLIIPKRRYSEAEMAFGKSAVLAVSEEAYKAVAGNAFFKKQLGRGNFAVSDSAPFERLSESEKARVYQSKSVESGKEVETMRKELAGKEAAIEALRKRLVEKDKEIEALKAQNAGGKKKQKGDTISHDIMEGVEAVAL